MSFHRVAYVTLLLVLIHNIDGKQNCTGSDGTLMWNNSNKSIELIIRAGRLNITVTDNGQGFSCKLREYSCYIECSFHNFFEIKNFNTAKDVYIRVKNDTNTEVKFIIASSARDFSSCSVEACLQNKIHRLLDRKEIQLEMPQDLYNIPLIKRMCLKIFNQDTFSQYNRVERKAIHKIIKISNQSVSFTNEDLAISVVKMNLNMKDTVVPINAPLICDDNTEIKTLIPKEAFQYVSNDQHKIGVVTYDSDHQFKFNLRNGFVLSKIIRIEVPDRSIANLSNPLVIQFPFINYTNATTKNYSILCQFYDEGDNTWKNDGCQTNQINSSLVECLCDHMTPFAVLMTEVKTDQWQILSYISYIGSGLSAFFCGCSILSYIVHGNIMKEVSMTIHVSLSGALFLLNMSFMFSEWAATLSEGVCVFIAVMIHYSLLCTFTWMAIEALHLYRLILRVFNIYIRHYVAKLSLIGWGVPALLVGGLLTVYDSRPFYGPLKITLSNTNTSNAFCWIKAPVVLYAVNISYFTIVFLFNFGILLAVSRKIFMLHKVDNRHRKMPACKDVGVVLGLLGLLGTTWGLIFFSFGYTNDPILYLFCILNSTQGFYIFFWICVTAKKNRDREQPLHSKNKSTTDMSK